MHKRVSLMSSTSSGFLFKNCYGYCSILGNNLQGSSHRLKAVGFRLWQRKGFIYEIEYLSYQDEDDIIPSEEKYFEYANAFFITENGEVIIFGATDVQPHTTCSHTFEDGILSRHYHNNNRGCSIKNYRGQICQKCKYTRSFSVSQVTTYTFCPH